MSVSGGGDWNIPAWAGVGMAVMSSIGTAILMGFNVGRWKESIAGEIKALRSEIHQQGVATQVTLDAMSVDSREFRDHVKEELEKVTQFNSDVTGKISGLINREAHAQGVAEGRAQGSAEDRRMRNRPYRGSEKRHDGNGDG